MLRNVFGIFASAANKMRHQAPYRTIQRCTQQAPKKSEPPIEIDGRFYYPGSEALKLKEQEINMHLNHHRLLAEAKRERIANGTDEAFEKYWQEQWRKNPGY